jgi:dihydropteroate synthase
LLDSTGATVKIRAMTAASRPAAVSPGPDPPVTGAGAISSILARRRPAVMGILNVTPDSFYDGGRFFSPDAAIAQAQLMVAEGADIIDIGAESTRPYGNAAAVPAEEERRRLAAVLPAVMRLGRPVSIDTMKAEVAEWALRQGAAIVNDVWGLQRDPGMADVVARNRIPVIVMHNRDAADPLIDIIADIDAFFERSLAIAARAGIFRDAIMLDLGIGFGKTPAQSMTAIARLGSFKKFNLPLLVGASRKRFIDAVTQPPSPPAPPAPPELRLGGSIAAHVLAVQNGAAIIRVHDVAATVQAMRVLAAIGSAS